MLTVKYIISFVALLGLVVYGIVIMAKRIASRRIPIKCSENGASIEFYNDLNSTDENKRRVGSSFRMNCTNDRLMLMVNYWGAEMDYKLRDDGFIEMIYSVRADEFSKLKELCDNAKTSKDIVTYLYKRFFKDGKEAKRNILKWLEDNNIVYSSYSNV